MALPSPLIIDLSRAYAYKLERGYSVAEAQAYIRDTFPQSTDYQRQEAYRQARRGIIVGESMATLLPTDQLRLALQGQRAPAEFVGVRVKVSWERQGPGGTTQTEYNDIYIPMRWTDTVQDVAMRVADWARTTLKQYGLQGAPRFEFVGPSLFPGATPGV